MRHRLALFLAVSMLLCSASAAADPAGPSETVRQPTKAREASLSDKSSRFARYWDDPNDGAPRVGSVKFRTWIWATTARSKNHLALGAMRVGTTIKLKSEEPVLGTKWFAVEPFGYIFLDDTTTRDFDSDYWKALSSVAPGDGPYPYQWAFSTGAPAYSRVPTEEEQERAEQRLGPKRTFKPLGEWSRSHEVLISKEAADKTVKLGQRPWYFAGHEGIKGSPWHPANPKLKMVPAGSGFAFAHAFEAAGRVWLVTPDLLLVPADRAFVYQRTDFEGVEIGGDVKLPLAWIRGRDANKLGREGEAFVTRGGTWQQKSRVGLTGKRVELDDVRYFETNDGAWLKEDGNVSVVEPVSELKFGIQADERWVHASITSGWMVAYEGLTPKWTTLWSGGKGGIPVPGNDPRVFHTTEMGIFPLEWKDRIDTMSPDKGAPSVFYFQDVPHIQYVKGPMALHVAFWHDNYGNLMSAECLNVSPRDGQWLFHFTRPEVPPGWNSIRPHKLTGASTKFYIVP